jgi:hypothetical protein
MESPIEKIIQHYKTFFEGHESEVLNWDLGPIKETIPEFEVIRFSPGEKSNLWVYCSVGASKIQNEEAGLHEFMIISPTENMRMVEMLAMVTYYHSLHGLQFADTVPIGEPWVEGSKCDNWLVSLPYPFDQMLEMIPHNHARLAWLLPITSEEREFIAENSLEALEQQFDEANLKYWQIDRKSVV